MYSVQTASWRKPTLEDLLVTLCRKHARAVTLHCWRLKWLKWWERKLNIEDPPRFECRGPHDGLPAMTVFWMWWWGPCILVHTSTLDFPLETVGLRGRFSLLSQGLASWQCFLRSFAASNMFGDHEDLLGMQWMSHFIWSARLQMYVTEQLITQFGAFSSNELRFRHRSFGSRTRWWPLKNCTFLF